MSALSSESSPNSLSSVMSKYRSGKLSQKQARKQWDATRKREDKKLNNIIKRTKSDIEDIKNKIDDDILSQKSISINGILQQRAETLKTISDLRERHFGQGISFDPLIPNLGEVNIMVNGEWLAVKQQPVVKNGEVLIPVRVVFEKLAPSIKLQKKGDVITLQHAGEKVVFTIGKKKAAVNGKAITLSAVPQLTNGQTMVPIGLTDEVFGATSTYDASVKTVFIKH